MSANIALSVGLLAVKLPGGQSKAGDGYNVSKSKHKYLVAWSMNVVCIDLLLSFSTIGNLYNKITICKINRLVQSFHSFSDDSKL